MTLYTSGDWIVDSESILTRAIYDFMCTKFNDIIIGDVRSFFGPISPPNDPRDPPMGGVKI